MNKDDQVAHFRHQAEDYSIKYLLWSLSLVQLALFHAQETRRV